jgi:hypothetical protein
MEKAEFLPLITALEVAMTAGWGAAITAEVEQRRKEKYEKARRLLEKRNAAIDTKQMAAAA